jgi:hypothetical protein
MKPVLRRIAIHGGLTAVVLGVVGLMLAELASIWLAASPGTRAATGDAVERPEENAEITATLRERVPLVMAVAGFAFVAIGELLLHFWRSRKPVPPQTPATPPPDPAEKLLEEILAKVESQREGDRGQESGDRSQETGNRKQETDQQPPATPPIS